MLEIGHFIGGKNVAGTSGRTADVMQPMDGTVRGKVALASRDELRKAVENAKQAQIGWGATNPQRRVRVLMKFLDLVHREYDELAEILAREHGVATVVAYPSVEDLVDGMVVTVDGDSGQVDVDDAEAGS